MKRDIEKDPELASYARDHAIRYSAGFMEGIPSSWKHALPSSWKISDFFSGGKNGKNAKKIINKEVDLYALCVNYIKMFIDNNFPNALSILDEMEKKCPASLQFWITKQKSEIEQQELLKSATDLLDKHG